MNLEKAYREPEQPGSFGGVEALFRATNGKFPRKDIKKWLSGKDSYTLHKPIKKKFRKNRVFVNRMNKQFQADLVDMQSLTKFNDGYRFLLTCICVLSKYAWAVPLHDKNAKTIVSAFEQIFSERIPLKLQTDADEGVSELLGFEPGEIKGKVESPYIAEPNASFPLIYVYCDLVEPQIVGDIQAPLLKIVKVEGKDGEVVNSHYTRPHFVPVIRQHFQTIELVLRLHSGDLVPFERGRVIAVIHFRMRQIV
ncbi:uncharacterized transposon-derived protein F54H12.3 [Trichonephila clavipes]|nr:uncharacterized transposon-derived protein F54H12.3 [Trichonephila clavipes]